MQITHLWGTFCSIPLSENYCSVIPFQRGHHSARKMELGQPHALWGCSDPTSSELSPPTRGLFQWRDTPLRGLKILCEEGKLSFEDYQVIKGYIHILIPALAPWQQNSSAALGLQITMLFTGNFLERQNFSNNSMSCYLSVHYMVKQTKKYHHARKVSTSDCALLFHV